VEAALIRIQAHGKAAGILTADQALAKRYLELGASFVAIGNDVSLLANGASRLLSDFQKANAAGTGSSDTAKVY
jgi:4-hydroxy-2-oxoheptanedioate aldolase